jgi:hypothetical protein
VIGNGFLPEGKRAAVVFTIDDVHPGRSSDAYEAGGDLGAGALGHVERLLEQHPDLHVTLFTTADWRELSPVPTRKLLARVPGLRDRVYLTRILPEGTMRLDRHPGFVSYLRSLPRTEVALHGLHHVHRGPRVPVEFQDQDAATCAAMLRSAFAIFESAGLDRPRGMTPPGWNVPGGLAAAMVAVGLDYVASARDIRTPVETGATASMSGLHGVPLYAPASIESGRLVHVPANFQATNPIERAIDIVEAGGLLSVKAHIVKTAFGHVQLDGMDDLYRNYLDALFGELRRRYGDSLWWTTAGELAARTRAAASAVA